MLQASVINTSGCTGSKKSFTALKNISSKYIGKVLNIFQLLKWQYIQVELNVEQFSFVSEGVSREGQSGADKHFLSEIKRKHTYNILYDKPTSTFFMHLFIMIIMILILFFGSWEIYLYFNFLKKYQQLRLGGEM